MSIAIYMDVHMDGAITRGLRARGVDVLTAQEDGADLFSDAALLDRATSLKRVLVSHDGDFLVEAAFRQKNSIPFAGIIYAARSKTNVGICVRDLELIGKTCEPVDLENQLWRLPI
jgi:hypothetical protein